MLKLPAAAPQETLGQNITSTAKSYRSQVKLLFVSVGALSHVLQCLFEKTSRLVSAIRNLVGTPVDESAGYMQPERY